MQHIEHNGKKLNANLNEPIDISIPMMAAEGRVAAWYVSPISIEPVRANGFLGSVAEGGTVNFRDIGFNPHGNGTHTECLGHITKEVHSVNQVLKQFFFVSKLITLTPHTVTEEKGWQKPGDKIITQVQLKTALQGKCPEALILRTLPNGDFKCTVNYSNTNPPYVEPEAMEYLIELGVKHFLLDLPSVDREQDGGLMLAHKAFWQTESANPRMDCTITELIYVREQVKDGDYLLNLQFAPFENDASPSRPVLFRLG